MIQDNDFDAYFLMFRKRKNWRRRMTSRMGYLLARGSGWKRKMLFGTYWWIEMEFDWRDNFIAFDAFMTYRKRWAYVSRSGRETRRWE